MSKWIDLKGNAVFLSFHTVFILLYVSVAFWPISADAKNYYVSVAYMIPPTLAMAASIVVFTRIKDKKKIFWGFLALAMTALFLGEAYWVAATLSQGVVILPPDSLATYLYLTGYGFLFMAMFSFWWLSFEKNNWLYGVLTTVLLIVTISAAYWFFQMEAAYGAYLRQGQYAELINGVYPVLDVALLVGFIATAVFSNVSNWAPWITAIVIGIALYAVGDIGFSFFSLADAYEPGTLVSNILDVFWMACYMFIFYGCYLRLKSVERLRAQKI